MTEDFDIGPLTWVKDEIDKSLNTVLENLAQLRDHLDDTTPLRFAQTHIYQASGALDMVGLEGCKYFCTETERSFSLLEKGDVATTPEIVAALSDAVQALKTYLDYLMQGGRDLPLRLHEALEPVLKIQGKQLDKTALFYPDTGVSAPKDLTTIELSESDFQHAVSKQRAIYQKSFLHWLKHRNADALVEMSDALLQVSYLQTRNALKSMWWSAGGFALALNDQELAEDAGAKRLCRKIDQELKLLQSGAAKANPQMLKEMLYFVAVSKASADYVNTIKATFDLSRYVESAADRYASGVVSANEIETAIEMSEVMARIGDIWNEVSNKIDFNAVDKNTSQVSADSVLVTRCADILAEHQSQSQQLSHVAVVDLYAALMQVINFLRDNGGTTSHPVLIEVAAGVHLLQDALKDYAQLSTDRFEPLLAEIRRLEFIATGASYDQLEQDRSTELDADTIKAVVLHLQESLKVIEQALDSFFRRSEDKAPLALTVKPLKNVASVFQMLNMDVPAQIAKLSQRYIDYFQSPQFDTNQGEFELLAESLSMLGIYAEGMPKVRPEYETAMQGALQRMDIALTNAIGSSAVAPAVESEVAEVVKASTSDEVKVVEQAHDDELLEIYLSEAEEVLAHIAQNIQALKIKPSNDEALVEVRRSFHTLKGSGRTVGLTALGDIAGKVETFLNELIDDKSGISFEQLNEVEQVTAAFATWMQELQDQQQLSLQPRKWIARIEAWSDASAPADKKKSDDIVLIGGTRKLSRQFYNIFLNESMLNITALEQDLVKMSDLGDLPPAVKSLHAIHTLGSNALAAGFTHMGELARASELWLDETSQHWTPAQHKLFARVVKAIAQMWQTVSMFKEPKEEKSLIKALHKATPSLTPSKTKSSKKSTVADKTIPDVELAEEVLLQALPESVEPTAAIDTSPEIAESVLDIGASVQADGTSDLPEATENDVIPVGLAQEEITEPDTATSQALLEESTADTDDVAAFVEQDTEADAEILALFEEEANELLPAIGAELRAWMTEPSQNAHPDALQRALHTLKGSARMAGKHQIGNLVHNMEEMVIQAQKRTPDAQAFDQLFSQFDTISSYIDGGLLPNIDAASLPQADIEQATATVGEVDEPKVDLPPPQVSPIEVTPPPPVKVVPKKADVAPSSERKSAQLIRMRADVLDRLINEAGEISIIRSRIDKEVIGFKSTSADLTESVNRLRNYLRELEIEAETQLQSRMTLLQEANERFDPLEFDRFTRLQELTRMMAESVNDISTIQNGLLVNLGQAEAALQQQNRMNRDLQQGLMSVRMLPFSQLSERMERIVRQTSRELKKRIDFVIEGEQTEIDRSVLDKIGAPLEHLLRNAVAHGVEVPEARKQAGKAEVGKLNLKVVAANDEIRITIQDDGAGVNLKKVKSVAVDHGLIAADAELSDQSLMSVIFEPGFSTSTEVTQIAGRGVGLDVVRSEVTGLGGRIDVDSQANQGTKFSIYLPVTLTVAQVLMVRSGNHQYAISVAMIEQAQKIKQDALKKAYDVGYVEWAGQQYPIHHITKLLNQSSDPVEHAYASVLLLRSGNYRLALHVDEMLGNQEVVIKPIGSELSRVPGIMGATVTGDGSIIFILNPLLLANRESLAIGSVKVNVESVNTEFHKLKALVVDDSLTMRKVLGRLMEREGFEVLVAKDGMDALQLLQQTVPDVILTDIEMPRMDGFGLARNIRDDSRMNNTPVIMISSRTADKHQNLAKDIGVDAFFGKPVHDEELIEKVNALISEKRVLH